MAQQIETVDDLTGEPGAVPVSFSIGGKAYELDLTPESFEALKNFLAPYIDASRLITPSSRSRSSRRTSAHAQLIRNVRAWANSQSQYNLGTRGRIPAEVIEAYQAEFPEEV
jgi:hypothetical protein